MTDLIDTLLFGQAAASKQILMEGDTPEKTGELAVNAGEFVSCVSLGMLKHTGTRVACRAGCSFCCHITVEVEAPEALAVAEHIRQQWSPDQKDRLTRKIEENLRVTQGLSRAQRGDSRIPCPLLDGQGVRLSPWGKAVVKQRKED
jgi:hypothetical protein